jgi:ferric-dicitrate binding protein FerR (iron transport regulator)
MMNRYKNAIVVCFLALFAFYVFSASCAFAEAAGQSYIEKWADYYMAKFERMKEEYQDLALRSQQALEKSYKALRLSEQANNQQAIKISQKAVSKSQAALDNSWRLLELSDKRIAAVKKAREIHIRSFTKYGMTEERPRKSEGHIALTTFIRGDLHIKAKDRWVRFYGNTPLREGDEVKTGPDSKCELLLTDGSRIRLNEKTIFRFLKSGEKESIYELMKGRLYHAFECVEQAERKESCIKVGIKVSSANISIRGTELVIDAPPLESQTIIVLDGIVEIKERTGKTIKVAKGEKLVITNSGRTERPIPIDLRSIKRWWEED